MYFERSFTMKPALKLDSLGRRLRWVREKFGGSLEEFGARLGVGRSYLSKLENGKNRNPSGPVVNMICQTYGIRREWLLEERGAPFVAEYLNRAAKAGKITGEEPPYPITLDERTKNLALIIACLLKAKDPSKEALAKALAEVLSHPMPLPGLAVETARLLCREVLHDQFPAVFGWQARPPETSESSLWLVLAKGTIARATYDQLLGEASAPGIENKVLTEAATRAKLAPVKSQLDDLLAALNRLTKESGKKTELADFLGAPLASVSRWLSGEREPGGETTLKMLHWVQEQERQQNTLGSATNTTKGKTQVRKSKYEKQTQVRKKG
jgi:transcriptional regulator with XRE-family HTH domain